MRGRALRYTGLQLAIVGLEAVWIALWALLLAPERVAEARLLCVLGALTLAWNRWLLARAWWDNAVGRVTGLAGMGILLVAAGWAAMPGVIAQAVAAASYSERVAILLDSRAFLVALFASALMIGRIVMLLRRQLTLERAIGRIRTSAVLGLAALALLHGEATPLRWLMVGLVGFALVVLPLARAMELAREHASSAMPFTARWVGTLLLGVTIVLALGISADAPLTPGHFSLLSAIIGFFRLILVNIFAILLELIVQVLLPVLQWLISLYSGIIRDVILPWLDALIQGRRAAAEGGLQLDSDLLQLMAVALVVVTFTLPIVVIWHLYRLFKQGALTAESAAETEEAVIAAAWYDWWKARQDAWRAWLSKFRHRRFGVDTVRELYKNLLLFGDDHALPRPSADTPYEYLEPLCRSYPALIKEFHALTDAYVAVRYGEHNFTEKEVRGLQNAWARIAAYREERATQPRPSPHPST